MNDLHRLEGGKRKAKKAGKRKTKKADKAVHAFLQDAKADGAFHIHRNSLYRFMNDMQHLLSPAMTSLTLKVGEIGKLYEQAEGDLRDVWHSMAIMRQEGHQIEHHIAPSPHLVRLLQSIIKKTVNTVTEQLEAQGPHFRGTILSSLSRKRDLPALLKQFQVLAEQLQHCRSQTMCMNPQVRCYSEPVRWKEIIKAIHTISAIARRSITPSKNPRIHTQTAAAHAESVIVGVSLRVGMMTALKVLHLMRELDASRKASDAEEGDDELDMSTTALVSPMGDAKRDVQMERALRFMLHLAFRGGFGGAGWMFHGDGTMREAEEAATEYRILPRIKRLWRKGRQWIRKPLLHSLSAELVNVVLSLTMTRFASGHPILRFPFTMPSQQHQQHHRRQSQRAWWTTWNIIFAILFLGTVALFLFLLLRPHPPRRADDVDARLASETGSADLITHAEAKFAAPPVIQQRPSGGFQLQARIINVPVPPSGEPLSPETDWIIAGLIVSLIFAPIALFNAAVIIGFAVDAAFVSAMSVCAPYTSAAMTIAASVAIADVLGGFGQAKLTAAASGCPPPPTASDVDFPSVLSPHGTPFSASPPVAFQMQFAAGNTVLVPSGNGDGSWRPYCMSNSLLDVSDPQYVETGGWLTVAIVEGDTQVSTNDEVASVISGPAKMARAMSWRRSYTIVRVSEGGGLFTTLGINEGSGTCGFQTPSTSQRSQVTFLGSAPEARDSTNVFVQPIGSTDGSYPYESDLSFMTSDPDATPGSAMWVPFSTNEADNPFGWEGPLLMAPTGGMVDGQMPLSVRIRHWMPPVSPLAIATKVNCGGDTFLVGGASNARPSGDQNVIDCNIYRVPNLTEAALLPGGPLMIDGSDSGDGQEEDWFMSAYTHARHDKVFAASVLPLWKNGDPITTFDADGLSKLCNAWCTIQSVMDGKLMGNIAPGSSVNVGFADVAGAGSGAHPPLGFRWFVSKVHWAANTVDEKYRTLFVHMTPELVQNLTLPSNSYFTNMTGSNLTNGMSLQRTAAGQSTVILGFSGVETGELLPTGVQSIVVKAP